MSRYNYQTRLTNKINYTTCSLYPTAQNRFNRMKTERRDHIEMSAVGAITNCTITTTEGHKHLINVTYTLMFDYLSTCQPACKSFTFPAFLEAVNSYNNYRHRPLWCTLKFCIQLKNTSNWKQHLCVLWLGLTFNLKTGERRRGKVRVAVVAEEKKYFMIFDDRFMISNFPVNGSLK